MESVMPISIWLIIATMIRTALTQKAHFIAHVSWDIVEMESRVLVR